MQNLIFECKKHSIPFSENQTLAGYTSFKIGGPADLFIIPKTIGQIKIIMKACSRFSIPFFILGDGANILVSDKGIRGCVISLKNLSGIKYDNNIVHAEAGSEISEVCEKSASWGLRGLENFFSMPGSVGGSVWMNARCYGISISDILHSVTVMDEYGEIKTYQANPEEFDYKKTPFQKTKEIILEACFSLSAGNPEALHKIMEEKHNDRKTKGHFDFPSAGSVFKNNRSFGEPTGKIIDTLGLRGYSIGGARISPKHANIIINADNATATDVLSLITLVKVKVKKEFGFDLEEEVIPAGDF